MDYRVDWSGPSDTLKAGHDPHASSVILSAKPLTAEGPWVNYRLMPMIDNLERDIDEATRVLLRYATEMGEPYAEALLGFCVDTLPSDGLRFLRELRDMLVSGGPLTESDYANWNTIARAAREVINRSLHRLSESRSPEAFHTAFVCVTELPCTLRRSLAASWRSSLIARFEIRITDDAALVTTQTTKAMRYAA